MFAKGLQITKKDQTFENELTGAEFKLYRTARAGETQDLMEINGKKCYPVATLDMSASSTASVDALGALKAGEAYYLVETKAPAGYIMLTDPLPVTLTITDAYTPKSSGAAAEEKPETGIYDWTQKALLMMDTSSSWVKQIDEDGHDVSNAGVLTANSVNETMYYEIANNAGVSLPAAGGRGTTWIYLLGSLLLLGCGITLVVRRRMA